MDMALSAQKTLLLRFHQENVSRAVPLGFQKVPARVIFRAPQFQDLSAGTKNGSTGTSHSSAELQGNPTALGEESKREGRIDSGRLREEQTQQAVTSFHHLLRQQSRKRGLTFNMKLRGQTDSRSAIKEAAAG